MVAVGGVGAVGVVVVVGAVGAVGAVVAVVVTDTTSPRRSSDRRRDGASRRAAPRYFSAALTSLISLFRMRSLSE